MKSKNEFASFADYREYLIAYYAGQILARSANELPFDLIVVVATNLVAALYPNEEL